MESPMSEVMRLIEAETQRIGQRPKELHVPKALREAVVTYLDRLDRCRGIIPDLAQNFIGEVTVFGVRLVEEKAT